MKTLKTRVVLGLCLLFFVATTHYGLAEAQQARPAETDPVVYVTNTGEKYHRANCKQLAKSRKAVKLSAAKANGYTACKPCNPPK